MAHICHIMKSSDWSFPRNLLSVCCYVVHPRLSRSLSWTREPAALLIPRLVPCRLCHCVIVHVSRSIYHEMVLWSHEKKVCLDDVQWNKGL